MCGWPYIFFKTRVQKFFQKSRSHIKSLGARRVKQKQEMHLGTTNIWRHSAKFCCLGHFALGICAPLLLKIDLFKHSGYFIYHHVHYTKSIHSAHTVYLCLLYGSQQRAIVPIYSTNFLVFIIQTERVHCAVRVERVYCAVRG